MIQAIAKNMQWRKRLARFMQAVIYEIGLDSSQNPNYLINQQ